MPRPPKSAPRAITEHSKSTPRPLSLQASDQLNLYVASVGAAQAIDAGDEFCVESNFEVEHLKTFI